MFWLGLLLAICFIPGYTGASVPTQWAVLSMVLPTSLWRKGPTTTLHKLFLLFIGWAAISTLWSINLYAYVWGLWLASIWALSFHFGTTLGTLEGLWKGLAFGLWVSSAVAVAQALDFAPVEANDIYQYSGLLFNTSVQGISIALVLIGLAIHRLWWYMPPLVIGLILAGSRGAFLILALALIARYIHWLVALGAIAATSLIFVLWVDPADSQRLQIWGVTLGALSPFGWGAGSFVDIHYIAKIKSIDTLLRPEFVHNDYLQAVYEYGIGALALGLIYAITLTRITAPEWPVFFAFALLSLFYFPAYHPLTAFIGFVTAGHIARGWPMAWPNLHRWGLAILSRGRIEEYGTDHPRRQGLSLVARASHSEV